MSDILVLFDSGYGMTEALAREVCHGVDSVPGMASRLRTVPAVSSTVETRESAVPESGPPYVERSDLADCAGLVLGSPTHFGNMTASLKYFFDNTIAEWLSGTLIGKPAGVFTSTSSLHGGQETTLLSMMLPLLHHGMLLMGLPYSENELLTTQTGGTPYGPSHLAGTDSKRPLSTEEKSLCSALGKRIATTAAALQHA